MSSALKDSAQANTVFNELREGMAQRGFLAADGAGTLLRVVAWMPVLGGLMYWGWTTTSVLGFIAASFALSVLQAQFAFIGHDASHGSAAGNRLLNRLAGQLCMGVINGLCFQEWRHRHLLHHRHCQDESHDPDMQFGTLFSMSAETLAARTSFGRWLGQYQAYYFWPSTLLFAHSLRYFAVAAALRQPRRYWADLLAFAGHICLWFVLPISLSVASGPQAIAVYLLGSSFLGLRLAAVFAINHVGMPSCAADASFLERQTLTSRNVTTARGMDWFFGGLNYQIEHHLLPACPRGRLREVEASIRPAVLTFGLPHHRCGWPQAVAEVTRHMNGVATSATRASTARGAVLGQTTQRAQDAE